MGLSNSCVPSFLTPFRALGLCLACIWLLSIPSTEASVDGVLHDTALLDIGSDLACHLIGCVRGQCVNTSAFPFYQCECNDGWATPFGRSWLPCILPNCSIDFTCGNNTATAAPPPTAPLITADANICSLPVCGNGECIKNGTGSNSTDNYECMCDSGYVNLGNQSDGYCIPSCAVGGACTNVTLPFGGNAPPPPPSQSSPGSSSSSGNQGTSPSPSTPSETSSTSEDQKSFLRNSLVLVATLAAFVTVWA